MPSSTPPRGSGIKSHHYGHAGRFMNQRGTAVDRDRQCAIMAVFRVGSGQLVPVKAQSERAAHRPNGRGSILDADPQFRGSKLHAELHMRPRRAQFRGEKLPAYNAPSDDWGLVCARSRLDPLFGLCVCEVRTPRPMGARHTWGRDVRVASPVNRDHTREHERKSEFCFEVGNETRNPPGRGRNPIKRWRVARAQVAKKPNHKSS